jgi:DNA-directed RNA polymerase subunit RPC12/RpoP
MQAILPQKRQSSRHAPHIMHLPSRRTILRYKLAAWLTPLLFLLIPASIGMGLYTLFVMEGEPARIALGLIMLLCVVTAILGWLSQGARCPRCLVGSFTRKNCSKHGSARTFLGSHRLHMAFSVIFRNFLQCPYCGESIAMKTRAPGSRRRHRRDQAPAPTRSDSRIV